MQRRDLVVAIDGPSGSGKSTVARTVAGRLGLRYLDTGSMYRAIAWLALHRGADPADATAMADIAEGTELLVGTDPRWPSIGAAGRDLTDAVREPDVTATVSAVSAVPAVRRSMVARQRQIIGSGGIVVEGRDIGTTVAPDAEVKVFLTADPEVRAARRARQDGEAGRSAATNSAADSLNRRDQADSTRAASPLQQAPDALVVDSTGLAVDEVVALITGRAREVRP